MGRRASASAMVSDRIPQSSDSDSPFGHTSRFLQSHAVAHSRYRRAVLRFLRWYRFHSHAVAGVSPLWRPLSSLRVVRFQRMV